MVLNESISVSCKPESVWNFWMDVSNDVLWRNGITNALWTSPPPYGIGSTGEHTQKDMGILAWEVSGFEDGRSFEFVHTAGGLKGSIGYFHVEAQKEGSLIRVRMQIRGPFIMRLMMPFMGNMMRKSIHGDIEKLRELLEEQHLNTF